jgi:hypothetical protein
MDMEAANVSAKISVEKKLIKVFQSKLNILKKQFNTGGWIRNVMSSSLNQQSNNVFTNNQGPGFLIPSFTRLSPKRRKEKQVVDKNPKIKKQKPFKQIGFI